MSEKLISAERLKQVLDKNFGHTGGAAVLEQLINIAPAVDAVEVTYCDQCSNHGHCIPEDTFRLAGVEKPFCCVGGRREENAVD